MSAETSTLLVNEPIMTTQDGLLLTETEMHTTTYLALPLVSDGQLKELPSELINGLRENYLAVGINLSEKEITTQAEMIQDSLETFQAALKTDDKVRSVAFAALNAFSVLSTQAQQTENVSGYEEYFPILSGAIIGASVGLAIGGKLDRGAIAVTNLGILFGTITGYFIGGSKNLPLVPIIALPTMILATTFLSVTPRTS